MLNQYDLKSIQKTFAVSGVRNQFTSDDIECMDAPDALPCGSTAAVTQSQHCAPFAYPTFYFRG